MCERLDEMIAATRERLHAFDETTVRADDALRLAEQYAELERLAAAGRTLAAGRVQQTRAWRATGATSASAWMAETTGSTISFAAKALNTAINVRRAPEVRDAMVAGKLSTLQAAEVSAAAAADPDSAPSLLALAERENVKVLRERCRTVIAAAEGDEDTNERLRRSRYAKHWTADDGSIRLDAKMAPDEGAPLVAVLEARARTYQQEASRAGHREPFEAHMADALTSLVDGAGAPAAVVSVTVSGAALERGHTIAGETCRVDGVGPISVAAARRLATEGVARVLETSGADVTRVAGAGRTVPASVRSALEARDPVCVVPGCNRRHGLEIDHITPFALGGKTALENLARLCRWHHAQKTYHGWVLSGGPGAWVWQRAARSPDPPPG